MTQRPALVDITTTAVGRDTLVETYETFFEHVSFRGEFRVLVTIDPAYGVSEEELARVGRFLVDLPHEVPQVREVVVDRLPLQAGLQGALSVLFARTTSTFGVHLEDDWRFTGVVDLDLLIHELVEQDSSEIVFTNSHVARGGTFTRPGESEQVPGSAAGLIRLTGASWAKHYLPLAPHVHQTQRWAPEVARSLALTDPLRCPDERVRERVLAERTTHRHNVLWTPEVVAEDTGRAWLAARGGYKAVTREHVGRQPAGPLLTGRSGPLPLDRSRALQERALEVIPGMTQTYQKRPLNFSEGRFPVYAERGEGAVLWDVDGTSYVDFVLALGAATLGYNHPAITNVVRERAGRGVLFSLPSPSEVQLSEDLARLVPGMDMVRLLKTGAEACSAAVRVARRHTGRDRALFVGYHGWHDQLGASGPGIPRSVGALVERRALHGSTDEHFLDDLRRQGRDLAAVVLSTPYDVVLTREFLREVRQACDDLGCLLVLDEAVTGFRLAPGGLGHLYGVQADIVCLAKGLSAGMPLAAILGPREIMQPMAETTVSTTTGGELLSIESARAALREYAAGSYYETIATLGARLRDGLNAHAYELGLGQIAFGYDPMPCLRFSSDPSTHAMRARQFQGGMAEAGYLFRRDVNFVSVVHTAAQVEDAVERAGSLLAALRGEWVR